MEHELVEVFDAIEAFVRDHGGDPTTALAEDSTALCRYVVATDRIEDALRGLDLLTRAGASTSVSLDIGGSTVVFASRPPTSGRWDLSGDLAEIGWLDDQDADDVDTSELADHWRESAIVADASVEVVLQKEQWTAPIAAAVKSAVWAGPRLQGFVAWMTDRPPEATLGLLLRDGPAVVLVRDWTGPPAQLGPDLTLADLNFRSTPSGSDAAWPATSEDWQRRALSLEVDQCPEPLSAGLIRAVGWSTAALLAEENLGDEAVPDRNASTRWRLRPLPADTPAVVPSVVLLSRWVSAEPTATRLSVARSIAGSRLSDPFSVVDSALVVEAAEIAYRQTVDLSVRAALAAQLELEQSFRSIDAEFTTVRSHLVETLDQTLLRAAAGLVAIAAAAAATEQDSAVFIRFGSLLIAAYVGFTGTVQLAMARRDAEQRLQAFEVVIGRRGAHLASDVLTVLGDWRRQLLRRLRWMRLALVGSAVVVAIGGLVVAANVDDGSGNSGPPSTTTSTSTSPASTSTTSP